MESTTTPIAAHQREVHETAAISILIARLEGSQSDWDSLDNKLLGVAGVGVAIAGIYLGALGAASGIRWWEWAAALTLGVLALIGAGISVWQYRTRTVMHAPTRESLDEHIDHPLALRSWMNALGQAIDANKTVVENKAKWVNRLLWLTSAEIAVALGAGFASLAF